MKAVEMDAINSWKGEMYVTLTSEVKSGKKHIFVFLNNLAELLCMCFNYF